MTMSGRDLDFQKLPVGTYQWHGPYFIKYDEDIRHVVGGSVMLLPDGKLFMFDGAGEIISPLPRKKFSIIINRNQIFCTFTPPRKNAYAA